jgi:hypothetical protein
MKHSIRVNGVHSDLIFCGVTNQSPVVRKGHARGRSFVAVIVGDDLNVIVLPDADTAASLIGEITRSR